ncbi:MAG: glycosyltransferase, partial [Patescibacteria group bacterium]
SSFAKLRNEALKYVKQPWVLYVDADERIVPELAKEIAVGIETESADVFSFNRQNIFFGQEFQHGGWQNDQVTRLFKKEALHKWSGEIHESPNYSGVVQVLHTPLVHFSHRNVADGLLKSASWTKLEAKQYIAADFPPVTTWTVIRKMLGELYRRLVRQKGYADGQAGVFEAIIQACNKAFVFIQVWELQQKPPLAEQYRNHDAKISRLWQKTNTL